MEGAGRDVEMSIYQDHVVLDNGIVKLTLSNPEGGVTDIQYGGISNLMETLKLESHRGYWDLNWNEPGAPLKSDSIEGNQFSVVVATPQQVEVSFVRNWDALLSPPSQIPLNIDIRYILTRGSSGFYAYAIYQRLAGFPDCDLVQTRMVFRLRKDKFEYMAIADDKQRIMAIEDDRTAGRCQTLAYPEAVLLTNPTNPELKGQMFHSGHYIGDNSCKFRNGEPWTKVLGPFYVHLNSSLEFVDPFLLWQDAKQQKFLQEQIWPQSFPASPYFLKKEERCTVFGRFLVNDRFISTQDFPADSAYIGLAAPGEKGSWQKESKGYQFWTKTEQNGFFQIVNIHSGEYNIYGWVPSIVGDYKNDIILNLSPGSSTDLGNLIYQPPRNGPTIWEIGTPDRTAAEFYVPDPIPKYINNLYINHPEKFRQYGLWERYTDLYPDNDLVYTVGVSDYTKDWFFSHVTRKNLDGTYQETTWQIKFYLDTLIQNGFYTLCIAIASSTRSILQVQCNDIKVDPPLFETPLIGQDNAIARHGIHGFYQLFNIQLNPYWLVHGDNTIFLTQKVNTGPFNGILYDYIRLEEPEVPY